MIFLIMDQEFKDFLSEHGYSTDNILTHRDLFKVVKR